MVVTDELRRVTGTLNPDATGDYLPAGTHNGKPYYERLDGVYKIWWEVIPVWNISTDLDVQAPGYWNKADEPVEGAYAPQGTYTGIPTVTEI